MAGVFTLLTIDAEFDQWKQKYGGCVVDGKDSKDSKADLKTRIDLLYNKICNDQINKTARGMNIATYVVSSIAYELICLRSENKLNDVATVDIEIRSHLNMDEEISKCLDDMKLPFRKCGYIIVTLDTEALKKY
jgi:hypothetical protein